MLIKLCRENYDSVFKFAVKMFLYKLKRLANRLL